MDVYTVACSSAKEDVAAKGSDGADYSPKDLQLLSMGSGNPDSLQLRLLVACPCRSARHLKGPTDCLSSVIHAQYTGMHSPLLPLLYSG